MQGPTDPGIQHRFTMDLSCHRLGFRLPFALGAASLVQVINLGKDRGVSTPRTRARGQESAL